MPGVFFLVSATARRTGILIFESICAIFGFLRNPLWTFSRASSSKRPQRDLESRKNDATLLEEMMNTSALRTLPKPEKKLPEITGRWLSCFLLTQKISFCSAWTRKSSWFGVLIFSCCLLILFPFGLGVEALKRTDVCLGSLWVIHEFIAVLIIGRMFAAEQEGDALDFMLAAGNPRSAILLGKIIFTAFQLISLQIPVTFFWIILYHIPMDLLQLMLAPLALVSAIFSLGTASLGALVVCLTARSLAKEILQPMLFFPLQTGSLLAAVSLSLQFAQNNVLNSASTSAWWTLLTVFPVFFTTLGCLLSNVLFSE